MTASCATGMLTPGGLGPASSSVPRPHSSHFPEKMPAVSPFGAPYVSPITPRLLPSWARTLEGTPSSLGYSNGPERSATTPGIMPTLLPVVAETVLVFSTATLTLRPPRNALLDLLAGCNVSRSPGHPSLKSDCASTAPSSSRIARACPHCAPFPALLHVSTDKHESKTRPRQIVFLSRDLRR